MPCPYLRGPLPESSDEPSGERYGCEARQHEDPVILDPATQVHLCNDDELFQYCRHFRRADSAVLAGNFASTAADDSLKAR